MRAVWGLVVGVFRGFRIAGRPHVFGVALLKVLFAMAWPIAGSFTVFSLNDDAIKGVGSDRNHNPWWGSANVSKADETQVADNPLPANWRQPHTQ